MTKLVVITGAAGGIGQACASTFKRSGWAVAGIDQVPEPEGGSFNHYARLDVAAPDFSSRLSEFFKGFPRLDCLVNNAGFLLAKALVDTTDKDLEQVMATNLAAPFVATRVAYPLLRASRGSVVNVSSVHAVATSPGLAAYAASKGGLAALTRATALELAADGIRVNAVLPGAVHTPMLRQGAARGADDPEAAVGRLAAQIPIGRVGQPGEIADLILFLADSDRSSFITGQVWAADGGVTARLASE